MNRFSDSRCEEIRGCQEINDETGNACDVKSTLQILDEFRKLYENRIEQIDKECNGGAEHTKLKIMQDWIRDLSEQNAVLVSTVEELEHEAAKRVVLLENKLHQTTKIISNLKQCGMDMGETMSVITSQMSLPEKTEEALQLKIFCLQSDIRCLLELIRRGRFQQSWSTDDLKFHEIQISDIPVPPHCLCAERKLEEDVTEPTMLRLQERIEQLRTTERAVAKQRMALEEKVCAQASQIDPTDDTITSIYNFDEPGDSLRNCPNLHT